MPVQARQNEVTFAEVSFQATEAVKSNDSTFQPDITIQVDSVVIGVSNTVSDALLGILNIKCVNSSALNRVAQEFERNGVNISKQTMSNWII